MIGKGHRERLELGDVVEDVMANDDVLSLHRLGHLRPRPEDLLVVDALPGGSFGEGGKHVVALVDADDAGRWRGKRKARPSCPDSDIEHRPALRQRVEGAPR